MRRRRARTTTRSPATVLPKRLTDTNELSSGVARSSFVRSFADSLGQLVGEEQTKAMFNTRHRLFFLRGFFFLATTTCGLSRLFFFESPSLSTNYSEKNTSTYFAKKKNGELLANAEERSWVITLADSGPIGNRPGQHKYILAALQNRSRIST